MLPKKPASMGKTEYMCTVCGAKQTSVGSMGRPMPGICPRSPSKRPHRWVVNRKY